MHTSRIREYNCALLDHAKLLSGPARARAASYIAGYLTHYALDCATHPYIYYKTGFKTDGDRTRKLRYSVNHRNFETSIDILMLKLISSERPSDKKLWELIHAGEPEARAAANVVSSAIKDAHRVEISPKRVYGAMRSISAVTRIMQSRSGRRKRIIELMEDITVGEHVLSSLIHSQEADSGIDFLNLQKRPWHMPWDNSTAYDSTFTEMLDRASQDACRMIEGSFMYLDGNISRDELSGLIGNASFATGQDAGLKLRFQFSDVVYS